MFRKAGRLFVLIRLLFLLLSVRFVLESFRPYRIRQIV